jgi:transposase
VLRQKLSRGQIAARLANMAPCLVGMEACVGAHYLSRQLLALAHNVKLVPGQFVKPFLKGQNISAIVGAILHFWLNYYVTPGVESYFGKLVVGYLGGWLSLFWGNDRLEEALAWAMRV